MEEREGKEGRREAGRGEIRERGKGDVRKGFSRLRRGLLRWNSDLV